MRALIIPQTHHMHVADWPEQPLGPGEVRVRVAAAGICAGDLSIFTGKNPYARLPVVAGHELAGTVVEVHSTVSTISVGARVAVEPFVACGTCYACRVGKTNCCANLRIIGVHQAGGYAETVVAPSKNCYEIPAEMPFTQAALVEPVTIALQACRRGQVGPDDTVLVLGCGPIGAFIIEVARELGATVYAADVLPNRLAVAEQLGAIPLLSDENLLEKVLEITQGEGMPVVIEATGVPKVIEQTVHLVAAGGRVVIAGLVKGGVGVTFPGLDFTRKELTLLGSRTEVGCFPESIRLLAEGRIRFARMATEFSMFDAGPELFAKLAEKPELIHKGILIV